LVFHRRDRAIEINAIEERSGNFMLISGNRCRQTFARSSSLLDSLKTARTRIHRTAQDELRRIGQRTVRTTDGDLPVLKRLSQEFEHMRGKFRQFIDK